jgi:DMSO/TMAO reductase YedYZ heme-binding membrane subunit
MVIVLGTSWARKPLRPSLWRTIHLLAVPAFALALLHGILAGSDAARTGMTIVYRVSGASVLFLVIVRGLTARPPRSARTASSARAAAPTAAPRERAAAS